VVGRGEKSLSLSNCSTRRIFLLASSQSIIHVREQVAAEFSTSKERRVSRDELKVADFG